MKDENGENDFFIEVNWDEQNEKINKSKILKIWLDDKRICYLKKEYLIALLFTIGTRAEQRKMIPQKIQRVKWYETVVSVKAKKDIRKGEDIVFPIKISLPAIEEEVVSEISKSYKIPEKTIEKTDSGILIPKKVI